MISAFTLMITAPFLRLNAAPVSQGESQLEKIAELLFNILPNNPVLPFLGGNTLQIVVLAIFIGVILLILGERARHVCIIIEECAIVFQMMMEQVCRLMPLFVFVSFLRQIWSGSATQILGLWKPFALFLLASGLISAITLAAVSARLKIAPSLLLKKTLPASLLGFSTASSMASYSASKDACENKLGVHPRLFDFGFPIGIVLYMPSVVVTFAVLSVWMAEVYGIQVNLSWYLMAFILSVTLAVAAPPTPGAMLTCSGILITQLNIPSDALILAFTLDVVLDYFMTGVNILMIQLELTAQADQLHMLDQDILHQAF